MTTHAGELDSGTAERFAKLALACVHREYPTKIAHSLNSAKDVQAPRELTPAFYGCYDWHSSVHGHWMLARLARTFPDAAFAGPAKQSLAESLTPENLKREAEYIRGEGRESFERPYGLAWLLQLASELRQWDDPEARRWAEGLGPLEDASVQRLQTWLPKLSRPVRSGEHSNTAFGMGLMLDYARATKRTQFEELLRSRVREFYLNDSGCPLSYEPSGEDFLSPCLAEADVMRRVLPRQEFATWLAQFLPSVPRDGSTSWLLPGVVTDPTDGKLAHLDGLNLSRAWMLRGIAAALPPTDVRLKSLKSTADEHSRDGLRAVTGEHYQGGHWLGSFAVYLLTERNLR
ncbi:MAG: hypothetical protein JWO80_3852 [Bryobacterales bacterium]|nr:hypothetical protein [Bryobacterales bacterium]